MTIAHTGRDATLVVRIDHQKVERRVLSSGTHTFNIYVDPVETARQVLIDYEIAGKSDSAEVRVEPVRKIQIYKKRAPLNPHPGEGGPAVEFAQHGSKESMQFAFPFAIENGQIHVDAARRLRPCSCLPFCDGHVTAPCSFGPRAAISNGTQAPNRSGRCASTCMQAKWRRQQVDCEAFRRLWRKP